MSRLIRRLSNASITSITSVGTPTSGLPGMVGSVSPMDVPADADPQACYEVFCSHWAQIKGIIVKQHASSGNRFHRIKASFDDVQAVANYATQMMYLLVEESQPTEGVLGRMLELTIGEAVMDRLLAWGLSPACCGEHTEDMKRELLRIYEMLLAQARQSVLMHNALLNPLLKLLIACSEYCSDRLELHLVLLLHQLCVSLAKDPVLLEYLFHASPSQGPAKFLLFSLLIPFLHRDGKVGQQARDALLLCISVSSQRETIAKYIIESTSLCPVLATGLGALYSRLPRKLDIKADHWHCLTREDWTVIPELCMFLHSLEFCNAVVQVAHPLVSNQLVQYFHDGFLVPIIGPALHQFADGDVNDVDNPPPQHEIVATTAYVNLFVSTITSPVLMKAFLQYLCTGQHEGRLVLDSLLTRIKSSSRLCLVTLSLFHTLVNLNCEDFMVELILKYLVPCNHIMVSQRRVIKEVDLHCKSADRFLSLRPACCKPQSTETAVVGSVPNGLRDTVNAAPGSVHSRTMPQSQNHANTRAIPHQSQGAVLKRQYSRSNSQVTESSLSDFETSHVEYLLDAKDGIRMCTQGTLHWSAPYDGIDPPPAILSPDSMSPAEDKSRTQSTSFDTTSTADEDAHLRSANKGSSPAELLSRSRERHRSTDLKLLANIQEVLSLSIGTENDMVDTSDVNITELFADEKFTIPQCQTLDAKKRSSFVNDAGSERPVENGLTDQNESPDDIESSQTKFDHQGSMNEMKVSTGKSRPRELNITGHGVKPSHESDSAFSSNNSPLLESSFLNGGTNASSRDIVLNNDGSSQKGSQVANWLQALGEDAGSASFIENLSSDKKKEKRVGITKQESERDSDEPCVFWEFDSEIEMSPSKAKNEPKSELGAGEGMQNEANQILTALGFFILKDQESSSSDQQNSPSTTVRCSQLQSESSEAESSKEPLSSSMKENHFALLNSTPKTSTAVRPMYSPLGRAIGMPSTGPFMDAIFSRLDTMMENSFYVNLLLTGIIARLAYYPQPLLRSYLLNTTMVLQPSIRSILQVLTSIKNKLDPYAASIPDFRNLLLRAKEYLFMREGGDNVYRGRSLTEIMVPVNVGRQRSSSFRTLAKHKTTIDHILRRGNRRNKSISASEKQKLARINEGSMALPAATAEYESLKTRNAVYCAVIFDEFLKELAAISQEHAVAFSEQELGLRENS